eukprot:symbB.v1.2.039298.t1/scaffold6469.1/size17866/1
MKCTATTDTYKDVACKFPRLTHWQFIERQLDLKRPVSTIYSVPLFQTSNFKLDWLHVVGLGVTPDCLGNCFHFLLPRLGKNASEQLSHLLLLIKQYYIEHDIKDGINNLTAGMVRASPSVSPKLKVKGAEARSLVGFAKALCEKYCDESKALDCGVKWAVIYLNKCHDLGLRRDTFNASNFQRAVQSFLLQYKSLEEAMGTDKLLWVLKPKFHMLFELAQTGDCPAMNWNYRDEEAGGTLARMARLTHWQFLERQLDLKRPISTIYSVPLFQTSNFKLDWLHVVDLGVTPDCLGNCFHFLLPRLGKNASEQLAHLLLLIKQYYIEHDIKDGINNLTAGMVRASPSVSPKLKVKGAEARSLVGFAKALCEKYCDESKALDCGVKWAVIYLNKCHDLGLHRDTFNASNFQRAVQSFLLQYKSLEEAMGTDKLLWVLKPKFHMMFELAQTGDCPAMNWNYRDEEAGGTLARMARCFGALEAAQGEEIQYATASEDLPAEEGVQSGKQNLEALLKGASGSEDSEEDGDSDDDMDALRMLGRAKSAMPGSGTSSANPAGQIDATTLSTIVQMELLQELRGRKKT